MKLGWIGIGRMGYEMAARAREGRRRRHGVEPHARRRRSRSRKYGAKIADSARRPRRAATSCSCMVSTYDDVKEVIAGPAGLLSGGKTPKIVVECSSISLDGLRPNCAIAARRRGVEMLAAPVSGNAKVIKAGRLSFVCSGPQAAFDAAQPYLKLIGAGARATSARASSRASSRSATTCMLGVVTQSLAEITMLAQKAGVPRHAFLDFINQSVMGSTFSRYKTPGVRQSRLQGHVHAVAAAQGPRPRSRRRPALRSADAARRAHAGHRPDADRARHGRRGFREAAGAAGARPPGSTLEPENVPVGDGLS